MVATVCVLPIHSSPAAIQRACSLEKHVLMSHKLKIDMHTHIIPKHLPKFAEKFGYGDFIHLVHKEDGTADMIKGDEFFRNIKSNCWDPEERVQDYAKFDTQVQVVCTIPVMFSYWAKPADCWELSKFLNDDLAQLQSDRPKQYIGLGTVPMQDTDTAVKELQRIKEIGLKGIQIGSNINDLNLSEEQFHPIFEACEALDLAVWCTRGI
jgi:aminocarboxymuconate-semialdehyde decarboxylase